MIGQGIMKPTYRITINMLSSADELLELKDIGCRTKQGNTDYIKNIALLRPFSDLPCLFVRDILIFYKKNYKKKLGLEKITLG